MSDALIVGVCADWFAKDDRCDRRRGLPTAQYRQIRLHVSSGVSICARWRYCRVIDDAIAPLPNFPDSSDVSKTSLPRNFLTSGVRKLVRSDWAMRPEILVIL